MPKVFTYCPALVGHFFCPDVVPSGAWCTHLKYFENFKKAPAL